MPRYGVFEVDLPENSNVNSLRNVICSYLGLDIAPPLLCVYLSDETTQLEPWAAVPATTPESPLVVCSEPGIATHVRLPQPLF